jgi:hypothetical protein
MLVYKQWDVTFNIIYGFSTINIFVLTASNEMFLYFHVSSKKRLHISGLPCLNRVNFPQESDALYSDQLNAEPAHSANAAEKTTRMFYSTQSSVVELLRSVERTTSSATQ